MKINFYTGTIDHQNIASSGGVQFVVSKISNALCKENFDVNIVSAFHGDSSCPFELDPNINLFYIQRLLRHNSNSSFLSKIWFWFIILFNINKFIRDKSVSFHISTSPAISIILIFYSFIFNLKVILWENVQFNVYSKFINRIRLFLFRYAHHVIVVSGSDLKYLRENFVKTTLIYNPNSFNSSIIENINISPKSNKNFVAAGRFTAQKGFDMLIDIADILRKKYLKDFKVTIVGDGHLKPNLIKKVKSLNLCDFIFFEPFTNNIHKIFKDNSIFLLPSRYEGLPIVLLDSQALGLPCVAFDCPTGPSEVIQNGTNGFLIDCYDLDLFASKMQLLATNDDLLLNQSINSSLKSKLFSIDSISNQWINLLKNEI